MDPYTLIEIIEIERTFFLAFFHLSFSSKSKDYENKMTSTSSESGTSKGLFGSLWPSASSEQSITSDASSDSLNGSNDVGMVELAPEPTSFLPTVTPSAPAPEIEYVYLDEHPFAQKPAARAEGSFGPLPMRTGYDKLLYGCGTAYLGGALSLTIAHCTYS